MRNLHLICLILALAATLAAQRHKLTINADTPEGRLLQQIGQENDPARKTTLAEEFISKFSKHDGAVWVLEQMVPAYLKINQFDKALAAGEKHLAADPDDVPTSHNCLKAAEGKKDPDLVIKWASATSKVARKAAAAPKPSAENEVESWKNNVDYSKQVDIYTEYSLYATALAIPDPAKKAALYEALSAQNPESQYMPQLNGTYFLALRQSNQNDKAIAFAEKILEKDQSNEDMLLLVADKHLRDKKDPKKVITLSNKLAEVMGAKPKPEGVSDADWTKRKNLLMGLGYWMAGITYGDEKQYMESDAALRKALPLVDDNNELKAQGLFYAGLANYRLGESKKDKKYLAEALKFNQQCATLKSGFQGQAAKNVAAIKQQLGIK